MKIPFLILALALWQLVSGQQTTAGTRAAAPNATRAGNPPAVAPNAARPSASPTGPPAAAPFRADIPPAASPRPPAASLHPAAPPAVAPFRAKDDLIGWIYAQIQWTAQAPAQRSGQLVAAAKQAWRTPRTPEEEQAWLDLLTNQGYSLLLSGAIVASTDAYAQAYEWARQYAEIVDAPMVLENVLKPFGNNYTRLGDYDQAFFIHQRALALALALEDKAALPGVYSNLANTCGNMGKPLLALAYCRRGLAVSGSHTSIAGLLWSEESDAYRALGKMDSARIAIRRSIVVLEIAERRNTVVGVGNAVASNASSVASDPSAIYWLLSAYQQAGDLCGATPSALVYYQKALALQQQLSTRRGESRQREKAKLYYRFGALYANLGQPEPATRWLDSCLAVLLPGKLVRPATASGAPASSAGPAGVGLSASAPGSPSGAPPSILPLSAAHPSAGDPSTAPSSAAPPLAALHSTVPSVAPLLTDLHSTPSSAAPLLANLRESDLYAENTLTDALYLLAGLQKNTDEALRLYQLAFAAERKGRLELITTSSKERWVADSRARYEKPLNLAWEGWLRTRQQKYARAMLSLMESSKAQLLLDEVLQQQQLRVLKNDSVQRRIRLLERAKVYYQKEMIGRRDSAGLDFLRSTEGQLAGLRKKASPLSSFALDSIKLPKGQTVISYFAGDKYLYTIECAHDSISYVEKAEMWRGWQDSVRSFVQHWFGAGPNAMIDHPGDYYKEALHWYQCLFAAHPLSPGKAYILLPDGALSLLPVDALVTPPTANRPSAASSAASGSPSSTGSRGSSASPAFPDSPAPPSSASPAPATPGSPASGSGSSAASASPANSGSPSSTGSPGSTASPAPAAPGSPASWPFVIREATISYAYSLQTLSQQQARSEGHGFSGFFLSSNRRDMPELKATLAEKQSIEPSIKDGHWFIDSQATTNAFREAITGSSILHISSHAFASPDSLDAPRLELFDSSFYLFELQGLNLHPGLVILNACKTGAGRPLTGDAIQSLARSFTAGGASAVVAGWWNVNDEAAAGLMGDFYTQMAFGAPPAAALRAAKLAWLKDPARSSLLKLPYYWAALNYQGNPAPLTMGETQVYTKPHADAHILRWIAGFVALSLIGLFVWQRRRQTVR